MAVADVLISFVLLVAIYAILAFGLNIKYGHTGLLDFGHVAFFLVGAYTATFFVLPPDEPGDFTEYVIGLGDVPLVGTWIVGIVVATVLAGIIGGLVALPTIRLREDYLAIMVLGISVIFQKVIQSETWLANGPDALRGYSPPMQFLFPLDLNTLAGPVIFGFVAFVAWTVATAALAIQHERDSRLPLSTLYAVTTFGLGTLDDGPFDHRFTVAGAAGVVAGVLSTVLLVVSGSILLMGVLISLFGWLVVLVGIAQRYGDLERREWAAGVALGTGLLVSLLPLAMASEVPVKIVGTLVLLGALVVAYSYGITNVGWINDSKITLVAVGSLWFVGIWYFLLPITGPLGSANVTGVARTLFENVVWMLRFGGDVGIGYRITAIGSVTLRLDYSRFLVAVFVLSMAVLYYVLEVTVHSPFGRVLRAVRNDEDVVKSLGKDPFVYKVQSMVLGSALAGFAGALWAMYAQGLTFTSFAPRVTFITLLILFVGGAGNNKGMVLGAAIFWAFQQATSQLAGYFPPALRVNILSFRLVVVGLLFLVLLYYLPEGLLGREEYTEEGLEREADTGEMFGPEAHTEGVSEE